MSNWYDPYMTIYGRPFSEVPQRVIDETRERLANLQSKEPLASIVIIAYNEETHLQACLWAISQIKCKYPVEIIGVDNDSKDRAASLPTAKTDCWWRTAIRRHWPTQWSG